MLEFCQMWGWVLLGGLVGGGGIALLGVAIVGMRMPFIGVCLAHSAMAGAVFAELAGVPRYPVSIIVAILASLVLAEFLDRTEVEAESANAIMFSLMIGLAFLGIGLAPEGKSELLTLLWGSLLFVDRKDLTLIFSGTFMLIAFFAFFNKELKAILFSPKIARACGIRYGTVLILFLILGGGVVSVNLNTVGGLMLYSLMTNPPATAIQICNSWFSLVVVSMFLGVVSSVGGFFISYFFNLPTGACIVLLSSFLFTLGLIYRKIWNEVRI